MSRVLVDTSAFICFLDGDDPQHERVVATFLGLVDEELVTHGYIVAESLAVIRRKFGVEGAAAFIDDLVTATKLITVPADVHDLALRRYRGSLPSSVSFVDQVSFALIERESISAALALDTDFATRGIDVLP